jgi:hypothetical protein
MVVVVVVMTVMTVMNLKKKKSAAIRMTSASSAQMTFKPF